MRTHVVTVLEFHSARTYTRERGLRPLATGQMNAFQDFWKSKVPSLRTLIGYLDLVAKAKIAVFCLPAFAKTHLPWNFWGNCNTKARQQ